MNNDSQPEPESKANETFSFKCRDAGMDHCDWTGTARTEELLFVLIEQHALTHHNLIVEGMGKEKIHSAIVRSGVAGEAAP
jgi:predicted small metal-binding protein